MKRYDPDQYGGGEGPAMVEDSQGQYVYHDDHLKALEARDAQWERAMRPEYSDIIPIVRERVQKGDG